MSNILSVFIFAAYVVCGFVVTLVWCFVCGYAAGWLCWGEKKEKTTCSTYPSKVGIH